MLPVCSNVCHASDGLYYSARPYCGVSSIIIHARNLVDLCTVCVIIYLSCSNSGQLIIQWNYSSVAYLSHCIFFVLVKYTIYCY